MKKEESVGKKAVVKKVAKAAKQPKWYNEGRVAGRFFETATIGKVINFLAEREGKAFTAKQIAKEISEPVEVVKGRLPWIANFGTESGVLSINNSKKVEGGRFLKLKDLSAKAFAKAAQWHTAAPAPKKKAPKSVKAKKAVKKAA